MQALPGVAAYFEMEASLFTPELVALDACDRFTKVCLSDSERNPNPNPNQGVLERLGAHRVAERRAGRAGTSARARRAAVDH